MQPQKNPNLATCGHRAKKNPRLASAKRIKSGAFGATRPMASSTVETSSNDAKKDSDVVICAGSRFRAKRQKELSPTWSLPSDIFLFFFGDSQLLRGEALSIP
jgi:hypothetical protein